MKQERVVPKGPIKWVILCLLFRTIATSTIKTVTAAATAVDVSQATVNEDFGVVTPITQCIAKELLSSSEVWDEELGEATSERGDTNPKTQTFVTNLSVAMHPLLFCFLMVVSARVNVTEAF